MACKGKSKMRVPAKDVGGFVQGAGAVGGALAPLATMVPFGTIAFGVGSLVGGLFGSSAADKQKKAEEAARRKAEEMRKEQERMAGIQQHQQQVYANTAMLRSEVEDSDAGQVLSWNQGGVNPVNYDLAAVGKDEVVMDKDGLLKPINAGSKRKVDDVLIQAPEFVLGNQKIGNSNTTFAQEGQKLVEMQNKKTGRTDRIAKNTIDLNTRNARSAAIGLVMQQEAQSARKGLKPKTKSINNVEVPAAVNGIAGVSSTPASLSGYLSGSATKAIGTSPVASSGGFNWGTIGSVAGGVMNALPALYNLFQGTQTPEPEPLRNVQSEYENMYLTNPYTSVIQNQMLSRRYDTSGMREEAMRMDNIGRRNIRQLYDNTGAIAAMTQAQNNATTRNLQNIRREARNVNNQYAGENAQMLAQLGAQTQQAAWNIGSARAAEQRRIDELNAQNLARQQAFTSTGISQVGQIGSQIISGINQARENKMMMDTIERTYGNVTNRSDYDARINKMIEAAVNNYATNNQQTTPQTVKQTVQPTTTNQVNAGYVDFLNAPDYYNPNFMYSSLMSPTALRSRYTY